MHQQIACIRLIQLQIYVHMEIAPSFDETQSTLYHAKTRSNFCYKNNKLQVFLYNEVNLAYFQ